MRFELDGQSLVLTLDRDEALLLEYVTQRAHNALTSTSPSSARERLLPDAYPDHPEHSEEFRRFTAEETVAAKLADLELVRAALIPAASAQRRPRRGTPVTLGVEDREAWLRALNSSRLVLAAELGLFDGDDPVYDPELRDLLDWLGSVQETFLSYL